MTSQAVNKLDLKKHLASTYGEEDLNSWFDPLRFEFNNRQLDVRFPHPYFAQWFFAHYEPVFTQAVREYYGTGVSVRYHSDGNEAKPQSCRYFQREQKREYPFGKEYTFESFLFNKKNYFPWASAREIAGGHQNRYNPYIICGHSSTGKTHLIRAIANEWSHIQKGSVFFGDVENLSYIYSPPQENLFLEARSRLFRYQIFLLEDIQKLAKFPYLQEELLLLFDYFHARKKQMIFSCTGKFQDLDYLSPQLKSRFDLGLIVHLEPPDFNIRSKFVQQQCLIKQVPLNKEQIFTLAQKFPDLRQLQGILLKLQAFKDLVDDHIGEHSFRQVVDQLEDSPPIDWKSILSRVAEHFAVPAEDILSSKRQKEIAAARQVAIYLCRRILGFSYPKLGGLFGGRDHSTALYAVKKVKKLQKDDPKMNKRILELEKECLHGD